MLLLVPQQRKQLNLAVLQQQQQQPLEYFHNTLLRIARRCSHLLWFQSSECKIHVHNTPPEHRNTNPSFSCPSFPHMWWVWCGVGWSQQRSLMKLCNCSKAKPVILKTQILLGLKQWSTKFNPISYFPLFSGLQISEFQYKLEYQYHNY